MLLLSSALMTSCSPKISSNDPFFTNFWVLNELNGVPVQTSNTERDAHIQFSYIEKKLSGSGGCNRINANFDLPKKNMLKIGEIASTRMACSDLKFETLFLKTLTDADSYAIVDETLLLKHDDRVIARFTHH